MPAPRRSLLPVLLLATAAACIVMMIVVWRTTAPVIDYKPLPEVAAKTTVRPPVKTTAAAPVHPPLPAPPDPRAIDPDIQRLSDELTNKDQPPTRDLEIVNQFITLYHKAFHSNPIGDNADITAVLTGNNYSKGILFPPNSPMIVRGQLVDRWGTPYWFHPNSGTQMEIRSAGPDKSLFTSDDIIMNPGPERIGS